MTTDETPRRDPQPSSCPNETDQNVSQFELGERLGKLDAGQRHLLQFAIAIFAATVTVSVVVLSDMSNDIVQMAPSDHSHDLPGQMQSAIGGLEYRIGVLMELLSTDKPTTVGFKESQPNPLEFSTQPAASDSNN